jgi:hypothetical protein
MRKIFFIVPALIVLIMPSCKKAVDTDGGSWIFKSTTYVSTQTNYLLGRWVANTGTGNPTGSLSFYFWDTIPKAGTYLITGGFNNNYGSQPVPTGYVYVQLTDSSIYNSYAPTGSVTQSVTVDTNSAGKYTFKLPPIEMVNYNNSYVILGYSTGVPSGTDSSLVSGTIYQTQ